MGLLHPTRDIPRLRSALKIQQYPAQIINNDDSGTKEGKRQRCRVRIPQIHRNIEDTDLPMAMPQRGGQTNAGAGVGSVDIPPQGAKVFVAYDEEDPHTMYYNQSPTTDDVHKDNELLQEDYPHTKGHVDHMGNKYSVNTKKEKETITDTHRSGSTMHRDKEGNFYMYAAKDMVLSCKGDFKVASDKKTTMYSKDNFKTGTDKKLTAMGKEKHELKTVKDTMIRNDPDMNSSKVKKVQSQDPTVVGERQRPQIADAGGQTSL